MVVRKKLDMSKQLSIFDIPTTPPPVEGSLDCGKDIRCLVADIIKKTALNRYDIAAKMSMLTGKDITKNQLDAWTAESRDAWRFPVEYMPAFEAACGTTRLTDYLADKRGGRVSYGKEVYTSLIGEKEIARARAKELFKQEDAQRSGELEVLKKIAGDEK